MPSITPSLAASILTLAAAAAAFGESPPPPVREIPQDDIGVETLEERRQEQLRAARDYRVFTGFKLHDRRAESGVGFTHRIVADAGKYYKPVHYDHGNGVAAADVDGDGHLDLYFVTQLGANELWRNRGDGTFENVTEAAGVGLGDRVSVSASFADTDNDGDADLYVTTVKMGNVLFENDGRGRFTDVTEHSGLGYVGHSSGAVFFDYNRDGLLDLFLTNVGIYTGDHRGLGGSYFGLDEAFTGHLYPDRTEPSRLFENKGGNRFEDVSEARSLLDGSWSGDAAFADLNGDLYPDLYVLNMQGDDHYYENVGGRSFVDKTAERFPRTPWGTMGVEFFDYDNDGDLDLYVTDMHSDMGTHVGPEDEKAKSRMAEVMPEMLLQGSHNNIWGNAFYRNDGGGRFTEVSDQIGAENYWPWGFSTGDLNADGYQDVFIAASMSYPYRYGINSVLLNEGGERFRDSEFVLGVEPRRGGASKTHWFDLQCSLGPDDAHPLCENREGPLSVWANLGTRSSVILDLEGDGDLDIVTNEFNAAPQVLVSDLAEKRKIRYVEVDLTGTRSNRDGLGAMVTVHAGGKAYTQQHDGKSGYLSQSSCPLYFGLGEAEKIDKIEVLWPSGIRQTVTEGLEIGSRVEIVEKG